MKGLFYLFSFVAFFFFFAHARSPSPPSYHLINIDHIGYEKLEEIKGDTSLKNWIELGDQLLVVSYRPSLNISRPSLKLNQIQMVGKIVYIIKTDNKEEIKKLDGDLLCHGWGIYVFQPKWKGEEDTKKQIESIFGNKAKLYDHNNVVLLRQSYNSERKTDNKEEGKEITDTRATIPEIVAQVSETRWFEGVTTLTTYNRYTRGSGIAAAQEWIVSQLRLLTAKNPNFTVTTQAFPVSGITAYNIIGTLRGSVTPDNWIIVGGHYDSTSQSPTTSAPGAEDNGSGAGAVLEMARVLTSYIPPSTVIFIFYSGEEQGLYGSRYHAQSLVDAGDRNKLKLMHNMDMIAYKAPSNPYYQVLLETNPEWEGLFDSYTENAQKFTELDLLYSLNAFGSDHEPYLNLGMPALLTIDGDWDNYPDYHRTTDTINKLTSKLGFEIVKLGIATVSQHLGFAS